MLEKQIFSRRLAAWFALNFGLLKSHHARQIESGDQSWRILLYQRIIDPETAPYPIPFTACVTPDSFERQCYYLRRNCNVLPLKDLMNMLRSGVEVPKNTVSITFDAGYRDCYDNAFSILKTFQLPATVFVPTAFVDTENMLWTDKVMVSLLTLAAHGYPFPKFTFLDKEFLRSLAPFGSLDEMNLQHIGALVEELKRRSHQERVIAMGIIAEHVKSHGDLPTERVFLSWNEISEMHASGLIDFGSQGHRHLYFTEVPDAELTQDMQISIAELRGHGIEPVPLISFPDGKFNKDCRKHLYSIGVKIALGPGRMPMPNLKQETCAVFGRTPIFEQVAFCPELFACRLWDYKFLEFEY